MHMTVSPSANCITTNKGTSLWQNGPFCHRRSGRARKGSPCLPHPPRELPLTTHTSECADSLLFLRRLTVLSMSFHCPSAVFHCPYATCHAALPLPAHRQMHAQRCHETVQGMFITPLHQQHASHTLASRRMDPSHTCGVNLLQDHTYIRL